MAYEFGNLSPADFEDLVRDLVGRELGIRFEAFAAGPDGGMDGRHAAGEGAIILQAKHYVGSTYAALKSKMRQERASIDRLSLTRYVLATSRAISPDNKRELAAVIGPSLQSEADLFGPGDLNALLKKYPDIEKSHIKLWLSGIAVLDCVVRAAAHTFNNITRAEIDAKVRVYAPNPSFTEARDVLEAQHVVIISGPPGVGKTTLAEMLSYAYIADGWKLVAIRNLDDGLASIDDKAKQVFLFDDFLGKVALDRHALSHKDSDLARLIKRIRSSPNARFLLTTRAYIFEEARRVSEQLSDQRLDISKYVLDVGIYTRRVKARILYNHLLVAAVPKSHITTLVESGDIAEIVDHRNYSPRIIEWMTDVAHIGTLKPEDYPAAFLDALAHPGRLWDIAFRTHISKMCRDLLFAQFFGSEYGVPINDLRDAYEGVHGHLCAKYGEPHDPKDFENALRILEGSFITITGKSVQFVNPSLRDYLAGYLDDLTLLRDFASAAREGNWARAVWEHGKRLELSGDEIASFAASFLRVAEEFGRLPVWKRVRDGAGYVLYSCGLSNTGRIELLITWWEASKDNRFIELAVALARTPVDGLDAWRDGDDAVNLIGKLRDGSYSSELPSTTELADYLEDALIVTIEGGMSSDDVKSISDAVEGWKRVLDSRTIAAVKDAIRSEFEDVRSVVDGIDSESTLNDHIEMLQEIAVRADIPSHDVDMAVKSVEARISEIEEQASVSESPAVKVAIPSERDAFDDTALANLFAPLLTL